MPWVGLQYVIVVFPDHTYSLFALKSLKNSKAAGIDLIGNEFLKYGTDILILPMVR